MGLELPKHLPLSQPHSPFPAQGPEQVSSWFHTVSLQLQGELEDTEGKEGVLHCTSTNTGKNCSFPSFEISYKITRLFFVLPLFLLGLPVTSLLSSL